MKTPPQPRCNGSRTIRNSPWAKVTAAHRAHFSRRQWSGGPVSTALFLVAAAGISGAAATARADDDAPAGAAIVVPRPQAAAADNAAEIRIYDVRDLAAGLNSDTRISTPAAVIMSRFSSEGTQWDGTASSLIVIDGEPRDEDDPAESAEAIDLLMNAVAGPHAADVQTLTPGVYMIVAPKENHELIERLLNDLRAIYAQRYDVELRAFMVARPDAPKVGEPCRIEPGAAFSSITSVAARRTPAEMRSTKIENYVGNWQPVVGNSVVAHDPEIRTVESGLTARVTVGSGRESEKGIPVRLSGLINDVSMLDASHPDAASGGSAAELSLPVTHVRSLDADVTAPNGQSTVACVVDGFDDATCIVIAVEIRRH